MEESEHKEEFKVSDKRRFTPEGEHREDKQPEAGAAEGTKAEGNDTSAYRGREKDREPGRAEQQKPPLPPMDFSTFILSMANTALFQLGLIRISEEEEPKKDLQAARQTIDIMSLMEEKTRGNLTDSEKKLLSETLFQLRMAFVEASK